ncbi:TetR/AcrR family transcriptional regulator [Pseudalkalibacillus sp. SCS-8]|uniref:TetR/AcrR family transcriptional regulator n=1 Tax=Pseudalkalibacillus nanhaiensis TaxID=3115291 RepID=UPI0032DA4FDF
MAPRKKVEKELTREMIMDAARELFSQEGYQNVSMRKIAKELDYSHGAIYYHFQNKAELFYALVDQDFHLLDLTVERILSLPLERSEKLKEILLGFIEFGLTHPSHYEIMFLIKDEEVQYHVQAAPDTSYRKFAEAVSTLSQGSPTVQQIWSIFLSLHGFVAHYWRHGTPYNEVQSLAEAHVSFILKALEQTA